MTRESTAPHLGQLGFQTAKDPSKPRGLAIVPETKDIVLTEREKYELEIYKKMKKTDYFRHYLDTFLDRRADMLTESMSQFPLHIRGLVRPPLTLSSPKTSSNMRAKTLVSAPKFPPNLLPHLSAMKPGPAVKEKPLSQLPVSNSVVDKHAVFRITIVDPHQSQAAYSVLPSPIPEVADDEAIDNIAVHVQDGR